jgi:Lamin Tail Domain/EGF domain
MRLLFAAVAIAFRLANAKTILLSEVYVRPTIGERGQFIELFNPTGIMVDMSKYKVCVGSGAPCTSLSGFLPAGAYYSICRDLSVYAYCNAGTALKLDGLTGSAAGLKLIDTTGAVVDSATWPELPVGVSIARGLDLSNLMTFVSTTIPSIGSGFIEGLAPTSKLTPAPSPMPSSDPTPKPSALPTFAPTEVPTPLPTTAPPTNPPTLSSTELCAKANCHKLADCTISNGIASCKCKSGYVGDGTLICDDIDGRITYVADLLPSPLSNTFFAFRM